jgi:hypothetical protein
LQSHDANVFLALFPDLALAQLHGRHYTIIDIRFRQSPICGGYL